MRKKVTQRRERYEGSVHEERKAHRFNTCIIRTEVLKNKEMLRINKTMIHFIKTRRSEKLNMNYKNIVLFDP